MIKITNRNLNTATQQTQNNNNKDYPNADHKMISLKQPLKNDTKRLQHFHKILTEIHIY